MQKICNCNLDSFANEVKNLAYLLKCRTCDILIQYGSPEAATYLSANSEGSSPEKSTVVLRVHNKGAPDPVGCSAYDLQSTGALCHA
jgi:hypothetical protein